MTASTFLFAKVVLAVVGVLALVSLFLIFRRSGRGLPRTLWQWLGATISAIMLAGAIFWFYVFSQLGSPFDRIGEEATGIQFRLVGDDSPHDLSEFNGQVVLLNFWATWCAPCLEEMSDLDKLMKNYKDRGLVVICVSDEKRDQLLAFAQKHPYEMLSAYLHPESHDQQAFFNQLLVRPTSFVVDRAGTIREVMIGSGNYDRFSALVSKYL